jgi:hypothetical protein
MPRTSMLALTELSHWIAGSLVAGTSSRFSDVYQRQSPGSRSASQPG